MGLFEKKFCDICGAKIGLLGNRKLEDGNMCGDCAAKLSPWFNERRSSTLAQIKEQLEYREANKAAVAAFHTTRTISNSPTIYIDEDAKKFMISSNSDLQKVNPDVIDFSAVVGCELDVSENREEIRRKNAQGEMVSFNPPRYEYSYDYNISIQVNHTYFNEISFKLNGASVEARNTGEIQKYQSLGDEIRNLFMNARAEVRAEAAAAAAPKGPVKCPSCGATGIPTATGCCEYCGSPLN